MTALGRERSSALGHPHPQLCELLRERKSRCVLNALSRSVRNVGSFLGLVRADSSSAFSTIPYRRTTPNWLSSHEALLARGCVIAFTTRHSDAVSGSHPHHLLWVERGDSTFDAGRTLGRRLADRSAASLLTPATVTVVVVPIANLVARFASVLPPLPLASIDVASSVALGDVMVRSTAARSGRQIIEVGKCGCGNYRRKCNTNDYIFHSLALPSG